MKLKMIQGVCIAIAAFGLTGCNALKNPNVIAEVEYVCQDAAEIVVPEILAEWPDKRPLFEQALAEAQAFTTSTNLSVEDLRAFLGRYGIDQAESRGARLAVAGAKIIVRRIGRDLSVDKPEILRAAARGIAAGLRDALATPVKPTARHRGEFQNLAGTGVPATAPPAQKPAAAAQPPLPKVEVFGDLGGNP